MATQLPCPAAILFMLDEAEEKKFEMDNGAQEAYAKAIRDVLNKNSSPQGEQKQILPPTPGNLSRELRLQQQKQVINSVLVSTDRVSARTIDFSIPYRVVPTPGAENESSMVVSSELPFTNVSPSTAAANVRKAMNLNTADFLDLTSELERLNEKLKQNRDCAGEEQSKFLSVDAFDTHAVENVREKVLRAKVHEAKVQFDARSYSVCKKILTELCEVTVSERLNPFIFQNIAACYYCLEEWDLAIHATRRALDFNPSLDVGYRRLFRIFLITERTAEAKALLEVNKRKSYWSSEVAAMKAYTNYTSLYESHLYAYCMRELEALIRIIPCSSFESLKVQLLSLDNCTDAVRYANERLQFYPNSVELKYWRSELRFRLASSFSSLQEVLKEFELAGEETKDIRFRNSVKFVLHIMEVVRKIECMLSQSINSSNNTRSQQWKELIDFCTASLNSSYRLHEGLLQCLLTARCRAYLEEKNWYFALDDVSKALHYTEEETARGELLLLKASCEAGLHRWQDAVKNAEKATRLLRTSAAEHQLQQLRAGLLQYKERLKNEEEKNFQSQQKRKYQQDATPSKDFESGQRGDHFPKMAPPSSFSDSDEEKGVRNCHDNSKKAKQSWKEHDSSSQKRAGKVPRLKEAFQVLSLSSIQNGTDVKKAYRALALKWHPDKWSGRSEEEKFEAEKRFKDIQNAYETIMSSLK